MKIGLTNTHKPFLTIMASFILAAPLAVVSSADDNTTTVFGDGSSTNLGGSLTIGDTGTNNVLIISNATTVANTTGTVGNAASANFNSALVTGAGSVWSNSAAFFYIGNTGSFNQVTITNGGRLVSGISATSQSRIGSEIGSAGNTVTVTGSNSVWTVIGRISFTLGSDGKLLILEGATVTSTSHLLMGDFHPSTVGGTNLVFVSGPNSLLDTANGTLFTIGRRNGFNQLIITNGGRVNSSVTALGGELTGASDNTAVVTGPDSIWDIDTSLKLQRRNNRLTIHDGGTVLSPSVEIGVASDQNNNTVFVDGGNLIITNASSTGTMNNIRGTNLLNSGILTVDSLFNTNGSLSTFLFNGGTLNTKATTISDGNTTVVGNGSSTATLNLVGGTHSFADDLLVNSNATLKGTGSVEGDTTVLGTLAPGDDVGILSLQNLTLTSNATFAIDLDGTTVGTDYDQADVTGFANISNSFLSLTLGYSPAKGDTFTILNNDANDAVLGEFAGLPNLTEFMSGGGEFKIIYNGGTGNDIILIAVPEPSAGTFFVLTVIAISLVRRRRA